MTKRCISVVTVFLFTLVFFAQAAVPAGAIGIHGTSVKIATIGSDYVLEAIIGPEKAFVNYVESFRSSVSSADLRLNVEIDGEVYSSSYVSHYGNYRKMEVKYPHQEIGKKVKVYFDATNGKVSEKTELEVMKSDLEFVSCGIDYTSLRFYYTDNYHEDDKMMPLESVTVKSGGMEFSGEYDAKEKRYNYTHTAKSGGTIEIDATDQYGYKYHNEVKVPSPSVTIEYLKSSVYETSFSVWNNDNRMKVDTIVLKSGKTSITIPKKDGTTSIRGKDLYSCKAKHAFKKNSIIDIYVTMMDGNVFHKQTRAAEVKPSLSVNKIYSDDEKITGKTKAGENVVIKMGGKTLTTTSDKNGFFSKALNCNKADTKFTVTTVTSLNCTRSVSGKVLLKKAGKPYIKKLKYGKKKVEVKNTGKICKNSKIILKVGNKTYKKTVKSAKKSYTFKVKKTKGGQKYSLKVTDRFGKLKYKIKPKKIKKKVKPVKKSYSGSSYGSGGSDSSSDSSDDYYYHASYSYGGHTASVTAHGSYDGNGGYNASAYASVY